MLFDSITKRYDLVAVPQNMDFSKLSLTFNVLALSSKRRPGKRLCPKLPFAIDLRTICTKMTELCPFLWPPSLWARYLLLRNFDWDP